MNEEQSRNPSGGDAADLTSRLRDALPPALRHLLNAASEAAGEVGAEIWLVGGPVRDLLLGREVADLDLAVRGDVPALAGIVASRQGGSVRSHVRFGTASVLFADGARLDLAAIRRERYQRPGALPEVEPADRIEEDLSRRDFSINAMAASIGRDGSHHLVDPCGGGVDLAAGVVRVLHGASFRDDPTRILRALRFAGRFGYRLEEETGELLRKALRDGALGTVSGMRLGSEMKALLDEPLPLRGLVAAAEAGLWPALPPDGLPEPEEAEALFSRSAEAISWYDGLGATAPVAPLEGWVVYWLALAAEGTVAGLEECARFLELGERAVRASVETISQSTTIAHFLKRPYHGSDSALHALLSPLLPETLVAAVTRSREPQVRRRIERFITVLNRVEPFINGNDLLSMGAEAGPRVGEVLERVFAAQLDGLVESREAALQEAQRLLTGPEAG
jgi:tRNA nucleotidyltransferase (CCA-adding enzyme)